MDIDAGVITALEYFKAKKSFNMDTEGRFEAMQEMLNELCDVCGIPILSFEMENIDGSFSGASEFNSSEYKIVMRGKLSIITFLHEFAHAFFFHTVNFLYQESNQFNYYKIEQLAKMWSHHYFRKVYPRQYDKLMAARNGGTPDILPSIDEEPSDQGDLLHE